MAINTQQLMEDIRAFIQDHPELNVLLNKREFSKTQLALAIRMMIAQFNRIHYLTRYTDRSFPEDASIDLQIFGSVSNLLKSNAVMNVRNHLPYNDGGLSVGQFAKSGEYTGVADMFNSAFVEGATQLKWSINVEEGFGGVSSPYRYDGWAWSWGHPL